MSKKSSKAHHLTRDGTTLLFDGIAPLLKVSLLILAVNTRPMKSSLVDEDLLSLPRLLLSDGVGQVHVFVKKMTPEHGKRLAAEGINTVIDIEQWELRGNNCVVEEFTDIFGRLDQEAFLVAEKAAADDQLAAEAEESLTLTKKSKRRASTRRLSFEATLPTEEDAVLLRPASHQRTRPISAPPQLDIVFEPLCSDENVLQLRIGPGNAETYRQTSVVEDSENASARETSVPVTGTPSESTQAQPSLLVDERKAVSDLQQLGLRVESTADAIPENLLQKRVHQLRKVIELLTTLPGGGVTGIATLGSKPTPTPSELVPPPAYTPTPGPPSGVITRPALPPPYTPAQSQRLPAPNRPQLPPAYSPSPLPAPRPTPSLPAYAPVRGPPLSVVRPAFPPPPRPPPAYSVIPEPNPADSTRRLSAVVRPSQSSNRTSILSIDQRPPSIVVTREEPPPPYEDSGVGRATSGQGAWVDVTRRRN
ncbi:hypothetical protein M427DRAFT_66941 [Gonapodya prolifera JEL478]|uniref:Uncharacterized protein n=1 Tax=Gonapodya prolifera (strain JEL478) TaxID=1344416 RepID=A0A139ASX6_GONPJ|nr:hypothetical protein M427DRAFT_66941 [Gonapodya prolifera JEL478]|eukprot:KXS19830.1 hypothetical protein M427DRAFT_66941 [Gonapodya prolifera JEL478]